MVLTVSLALGAALLSAAGFVLQQHAAAQAPANERLSFRLLLRLVRRPLWLGGVAAMAGGDVLGAVALGSGSLGLVEPVMAANILFALPLAALWHRRHLSAREWIGAGAIIVGLAVFIAVGNPHGGHTNALPWPNWVFSGGTIVVIVGALVAFARRRNAALQATILALGAGMLYGLQDALTQRTMALLGHGVLAVLVNWPAFSVVAIAVVGILLAQSAFEAAPLSASLPAITAAEPLTGIAFGVGVYHEYLDLSPAPLALELLGLVVAVVGVVLVARSPIVTTVPAPADARAQAPQPALEEPAPAAVVHAGAPRPASTMARGGRMT